MMSSAVPDSGGLPAAPRAGADLRAARERLGWPIDAVSRALRIRLPHLEALEEGRIDLLPGNAYAVGFLRLYAKTLGLDPDEIARRFKAEASQVNRRTELVFPAPMPQRGLPAGAVVLLGVVLAIVAYAGWYRLSGDGRLPAEAVAPVPQRLATLAEQAGRPAPPLTTASATHVATPAVTPPPPTTAPSEASTTVAGGLPAPAASVLPAASPQLTPAGAASAGPQIAAVAPSPVVLAQPPVPALSPTSAAAAPVPPIAISTPQPPQIVLEATADAWLEVRDRNGSILLNRVLHEGDSWAVPPGPDLLLTTGNAGGTEIIVDGVAYPVPGGSGAVRRGLPLDASLIKAGKLAPSAPGSTEQSGATSASFAQPADQ